MAKKDQIDNATFILTVEDNYELLNLDNIFLAKLDLKGHFIRINNNLHDLINNPNLSHKSKPFFKYFPKFYQSQFESLLKAKSPTKFVDSFTYRNDSITIVWSIYTKYLPKYFYLIGNGNTLFLKQVQDLLNNEKRVIDKTINQTMPYFITDLTSGKLTEYNKQFAKIMNFDPNKSYIGLDMKNYWRSKLDRNVLFNKLEKDGSINNYHAKVSDYNGKPLDVVVSGRYLYNNKGEKCNLQIVMDYNATQKNFITKIFENNAFLEHKIKGRTKYLTQMNQLLDSKNIEIEKKNIVLNELIERLQHSEDHLHQSITNNVNNVVLPIIHKLKVDDYNSERTLKLIDNVEKNLRSITSNFGNSVTSELNMLSKREVEICSFIKSGLSSKEIAKILSISETTVVSHRNRIRKKLEINNTNTNLATYLNSL